MPPRDGNIDPIGPGFIRNVIAGVRTVVSGVNPNNWFGPSQPMAPQAPEEVKGRAFDYQPGWNLHMRPRQDEQVTFETLRALADSYDLDDEPDPEDDGEDDENEDLEKAAQATHSAADAAERKVAERIYTALRAGALAAEQIADAAHRMMAPDAAVGALRRSGMGRLYGMAIDRLLPVMEAGGRHALDAAIVQQPIAQLEKADPARLKVNIGQRNGKIASFLDVYRMDKIRDISDEQEQLIRNVVTDSMAAGHPPAKMASLIREHIGLTPYQASQVANYRADLE